MRTLYNSNPLDSYQQYSTLDLLEFYNSRKERTVYTYSTIVQPLGTMFSTTIDITVKIPFD